MMRPAKAITGNTASSRSLDLTFSIHGLIRLIRTKLLWNKLQRSKVDVSKYYYSVFFSASSAAWLDYRDLLDGQRRGKGPSHPSSHAQMLLPIAYGLWRENFLWRKLSGIRLRKSQKAIRIRFYILKKKKFKTVRISLLVSWCFNC